MDPQVGGVGARDRDAWVQEGGQGQNLLSACEEGKAEGYTARCSVGGANRDRELHTFIG